MKFAVVWKPKADNQLTEIWLDSADRAEITAAARDIDQKLERNPLDVGESRSGNDRLMFEGPLSVYYRVDVPAQRVLVLLVGPRGRKSQ